MFVHTFVFRQRLSARDTYCLPLKTARNILRTPLSVNPSEVEYRRPNDEIAQLVVVSTDCLLRRTNEPLTLPQFLPFQATAAP